MTPVSVPNFVKVINSVIRQSGTKPADVAFLGLLHAKRSYILGILDAVGIGEDNILYPWDYGHIQTIDTILALERALTFGKVKSGDLVVLASAGAGYSWGAASLRWGR
ncbi:MAG: 3-oxoacyl-[acyl-carrier-protein] synthase III C-terminal domain-containing protein [bacterium]